MTKSLGEATATEEAAIKTHEALIAAKTKEVEALTAQIEKEQTRIGDLGVEIAGMENDVEDTTQSLAEDKKFIEELAENCKKKEKEWAGIQKLRQEELVALTDTIKILNDDDALELFKKTLPSPAASFVQIQVTESVARSRALSAIRSAQLLARTGRGKN